MEMAPFLKADGLEDGYKVLADFNDIVLAGIQSKYGVQFVTWDWSFDRKGVSHGHYYERLRGRAIRDMKRTNGRISFKDAMDFQKSVYAMSRPVQ